MIHLKVVRQPSGPTATLGTLWTSQDGQDWSQFSRTLEDVVREVQGQPVASWKVPGKTAIPRGRYLVTLDFSDRFQKIMPHILDVPGFGGVRFHGGNTDADTEGCILVAKNQIGPDLIQGSMASELIALLQAAGGKASVEIA
jgi:hypothetical protein